MKKDAENETPLKKMRTFIEKDAAWIRNVFNKMQRMDKVKKWKNDARVEKDAEAKKRCKLKEKM